MKATRASINDPLSKSDAEKVHVACDLCGADTKELLFEKNTFRHVRCDQCGLVYVTPRLKDFVGQQESFYNRLANYSSKHARPFDRFISRDIRRIEKGLDIFVCHTHKGHRLKIWAEKV